MPELSKPLTDLFAKVVLRARRSPATMVRLRVLIFITFEGYEGRPLGGEARLVALLGGLNKGIVRKGIAGSLASPEEKYVFLVQGFDLSHWLRWMSEWFELNPAHSKVFKQLEDDLKRLL